MESVDYLDTFIAVAPDLDAAVATIPPLRAGKPIVASATWQLIHDPPYELTPGDVLFTVWADRREIPPSDLGKRYG